VGRSLESPLLSQRWRYPRNPSGWMPRTAGTPILALSLLKVPKSTFCVPGERYSLSLSLGRSKACRCLRAFKERQVVDTVSLIPSARSLLVTAPARYSLHGHYREIWIAVPENSTIKALRQNAYRIRSR
jgi:hypothetical protein